MKNTITTSSIEYNLNKEVDRVSAQLYTVAIIFPVITNLTNIVVLCRRTLRSSSCSHYFLDLAISTIISMFVHNRFGIFLNSSPFGCRCLSFSIPSSALFVTIMLIFAAFDRYFGSSFSVHLRNLGRVSVARKVIICALILTIIYSYPLIIISYWNYNTN